MDRARPPTAARSRGAPRSLPAWAVVSLVVEGLEQLDELAVAPARRRVDEFERLVAG